MLTNPQAAAEPEPRTLVIDADVLSHERISGIGHTLRGLVQALAEDPVAQRRFRMRLLAPVDGVGRVRGRTPPDVQVVRMPMPIRGWDRWMSLPLLPPLDTMAGKGIYVFPHFGNWPLRASRSLTFMHDIAFLRLPETVGGNLSMLVRSTGRWIERTDIVVTVSEFSRGELQRCLGLTPSRTAVVPWGVDTRVFRPASAGDIATVRARHALPEAYVLFLGNIAPRKNVARLVRGYRALPAALRESHPLVLAGGSGWNAREIAAEIAAARAAGAHIVVPPSYVDDDELPALISGATALAQPSLYEGFGIAPLQAMACDVPVVVAANSAQPEVVGDAGVYVDAHDEADITAGLEAVLGDAALRARLIAAGRRRVAEFTWARTVECFLRAVDRATA